jgi:hypothetical protein
MLIGISAGPISKYIYQYAFQSNNMSNVTENIKKILESTYELVNWTNNQLLYETNRGNDKLKLIEKESEYSKSQAVDAYLVNRLYAIFYLL